MVESRRFTVRAATVDDARACAALLEDTDSGRTPPSAAEVAGWVQTGSLVFVAEHEGRVRAMARQWSDDGIDWLDNLASDLAWGGRAVLSRIETFAQDRGIRIVRTRIPDEPIVEDYFSWFGYRAVAKGPAPDGAPEITVERRVPLLTVREQRRSDAQVLASRTGGDPWDFERMPLPGWFVLADGDRFAGYVRVRDAGRGRGAITAPVLEPGYELRRLELWMVERAVYYAETHGMASLVLDESAGLVALARDLETAGWVRAHQGWTRSLANAPSYRSAAEGGAGDPEFRDD